MEIDSVTTILFFCASISAGVFFGALRSKLFATKSENKLHYGFYAFGLITLITATIVPFFFSFGESVIFTIAWLSAIIFALTLLVFTKFYLVTKTNYAVSELAPIINKFTEGADKDEIKLFGGDLSFFGIHPMEINGNSQYTHLRSQGFRKVLILCERPADTTTEIRYGKLYSELGHIEMKFYKPTSADLKVRGRIVKCNNVIKLLMYKKIAPGIYEAIETDTADSKGALYENIWQLVWSLADTPNQATIDSYIKLYTGSR